MSHYAVMVICRKGTRDDIESLLAPYDENIEVAPYTRKTKAELIAEEIESLNTARRSHQAAIAAESEEAYLKLAEASDEPYYRNYAYAKNDVPEKLLTVDINDEEAVYQLLREEWKDDIFDEDGGLISTYNPNSKWDWYEIGGRWDDALKLKKGGSANEGYASEIDWDAMFSLSKEDTEHLERFWDEYVLRKLPEGVSEEDAADYLAEEFGFVLYAPKYFLKTYGTKENYLHHMGLWTTYAVLDDKGWHAAGNMGWFGVHSEGEDERKDWEKNFRARFIDTLDPEDEVTIVDCHI